MRRRTALFHTIFLLPAVGLMSPGCDEESINPEATGACCFNTGACESISERQCRERGGFYGGDRTVCDPNPCPPPVGACCLPDGTCKVVSLFSCDRQEGTYAGDLTNCSPNPCPQPMGACCLPNNFCELLRHDVCIGEGGTFHVSETCDPSPCGPPMGACCYEEARCEIDTETRCGERGGSYQGDFTACLPNPCRPLHLQGGFSISGCQPQRLGNWPEGYLDFKTAPEVTVREFPGSFDICYWHVPLGAWIEIRFDLAAIPAPDSMTFAFLAKAPDGRQSFLDFYVNGAPVLPCSQINDCPCYYVLDWSGIGPYLIGGEVNTIRIVVDPSCNPEGELVQMQAIGVEAWDRQTWSGSSERPLSVGCPPEDRIEPRCFLER